MHRIPTLLAAAALLPLAAADMHLADLRLGVGMLSEDFRGASSTTVTGSEGSVTTTRSSEDGRDADDHYRAQVQYVGGSLSAGGGLIWGLGIAVNHATWDNGDQEAHATTPVANVMLGYGYAFTPNWHAELAPFAGFGGTFYTVTDDGEAKTDEDWIPYVEYGAKIGTYFSIGEGFQVGLEVPWMIGRFDPEYDYESAGDDRVTVTDERENRGFGALLTIGGRF